MFTIGSCFARNIEAHLSTLGCKVPMLDFHLPPEEFDGQPHAAMNRFHPPAFRQCLEWAGRIFDRDGKAAWADCEPLAFDFGEGRFFDLDMATAQAVPKPRFIERRQHIYDVFSAAFTADCMMMTPGLIEAWRDTATGLFLYDAPHHRPMLVKAARWEFEVLSYQRCLEDMLAAIDAVRSRNPSIKILVTTSPVPLGVTFSGRDITIANSHSKAVLRAVCDAVISERPDVDYFPSYEIATLSDPAVVWKADRLHVSQGFIGKIVGYMLDHYLEGVDEAAAHYQRARTLIADGDFAEGEKAARAALEVRPSHAEAKAALGEALVRQRRWVEAEAVLLPLAETDPERCDVRVRLARAMVGQDRLAEGLELLEAAAALPSFTLADFRAAEGILVRAPADTAERIAAMGVERFPLHVEAYPPFVDALVRGGRKAEAIPVLRRACALSKPPAALLLQLADLLAQAGETEEALSRLGTVLAAEPKNKPAAALKAKLLISAAAEAAVAP